MFVAGAYIFHGKYPTALSTLSTRLRDQLREKIRRNTLRRRGDSVTKVNDWIKMNKHRGKGILIDFLDSI